jgi:hypothetical protein
MMAGFVNKGLLCRRLWLSSSRHGFGNENFVSIWVPAGTPEPVKHGGAFLKPVLALHWFAVLRLEFTARFRVGSAG